VAVTELSIRLPAIVATLDPNFAFDKLLQKVEIQATLLAILAGVIGYFINGWLTKTRPFVSVIQTSGASRRVGSKVQVPDRAVKSSEQSNLCNGLSNSSRLKDAMDALATTKKIEDRAQEVIDLIDAFTAAVNGIELSAAQGLLEELMLDEDFDNWACTLMGERIITVPTFDVTVTRLIELSEESQTRDGCFGIGFPRNTLRFGSGLNKLTLYKTTVRAFVELVCRLEYQKIAEVLAAAKTELGKELSLARDISPQLQEIANKNSQWSLRLYVANLGNAPFLVQTEADLEIKDQSGACYGVTCYLILLKKNQDGELRRVKAETPLAIQSQRDETFGFVTNKTQQELKEGGTIRAMFKSGSAQCRVRFTVERPGQFRKQVVTSTWTKFVDARPNSA